MNPLAHPTPSSAAASTRGAASPSLELLEARQLRDALKLLLSKERIAMAEFLVALADFDQRRGWEPLGHASLFAFLHVELRLSKSAAYFRRSAAELLRVFPEVIVPLREGRLCLSTIGELAKVLTEENRAVVTPRFFGLSAREAQELVAEFLPREVPSSRMVVTSVQDHPVAPLAMATLPLLSLASAPSTGAHPSVVPPSRFPTSGIADGGGSRFVSRRDEIVPLTAELRRVHFNVCKQVVGKLQAAREGLSHAIPGATMEQVLEVALDLLLEKQARARGLVKRPRTAAPAPSASETGTATMEAAARPPSEGPRPADVGPEQPLVLTEPPPPRRTGPRVRIPAAVRRAVWHRDQGCCAWPLDSGGTCGSTHRLEFDHIEPWARFSEPTVDNIRVVCHLHNTLAARRTFGERCMARYAKRRHDWSS